MSTTGYLKDSQGAYIVKDPGSTLDYTIDWTDWLGSTDGDICDAVTYTVDAGLDPSSAIGGSETAVTDTTTRITLTGGTAGTIYNVRAEMTTAAGRIVVRNFRVKVEAQQL